MKVILKEDVKSLGKKGEIVNVSDGYAKNKLIPGKLAVPADGKNMNDLKLQKKHEDKVAQEQLEAAQALGKELEGKVVKVAVKSGEGGKVFGSVSSKEVAKAAKEQLDLELDKKKMQMPEPLKTLGFHEVTIKLHPKVSAVLRVNVVEES
ncbi:MAG: 50S ribosomal protein L9 [Lachnospiraceae bacterium]|jgi:large subunit ribosomal protein L9|nr:50S ribosomal protein L9 [Lachnospiraceae bacterium]